MADALSTDPVFTSRAKLWVKKNVPVKDPIVIVGFPGIGRIGELTANYFLECNKNEYVGIITSPYFSTQTIVDAHGVAHILGMRIYRLKVEWTSNDLLIVKGDQHQEIMGGEYESSELLLNFLQKKGVKLIITIGGMYASGATKKDTFVFASSPELTSAFKNVGLSVTRPGAPVVGAAGIIVGLASMRGIPSACLLGETSGDRPDVEAAKAVVLALGKFLNFVPNLEFLDREAENVEKIMKIYEESYAKIIENPSVSKIMSETKGPEYVS